MDAKEIEKIENESDRLKAITEYIKSSGKFSTKKLHTLVDSLDISIDKTGLAKISKSNQTRILDVVAKRVNNKIENKKAAEKDRLFKVKFYLGNRYKDIVKKYPEGEAKRRLKVLFAQDCKNQGLSDEEITKPIKQSSFADMAKIKNSILNLNESRPFIDIVTDSLYEDIKKLNELDHSNYMNIHKNDSPTFTQNSSQNEQQKPLFSPEYFNRIDAQIANMRQNGVYDLSLTNLISEVKDVIQTMNDGVQKEILIEKLKTVEEFKSMSKFVEKSKQNEEQEQMETQEQIEPENAEELEQTLGPSALRPHTDD